MKSATKQTVLRFGRMLLILTFVLTVGVATASASKYKPSNSQTQVDPTSKAKADWDVAPVPDLSAEQQAQLSALNPDECFGFPETTIFIDENGVLTVGGCGQTFTLTDLAAQPLVTSDMLELIDPIEKIWILRVKLHITEGVNFNFYGGEAGDVNWLRLRSDDESGVYLRGVNSTLRFVDTKVTSWNESLNDVDLDWDTAGRSYVSVRTNLYQERVPAPATDCATNGGSQEVYEARMDVINSEMSYLGYYAGESYGVSWKVFAHDRFITGRELYEQVDVFGDVRNSKFDNGFFGVYTYGGYCMNFTDNVFENNAQYGLDPHDDSDNLLIDGNIFRNNGSHGMICSVYCNDLVITNNESYGNGLHGFMLHRHTNNTLVENNKSYDNGGVGIIVFDSHNNIIRNNEMRNNAEAGFALTVGSSQNMIEDNVIEGLRDVSAEKGYVLSSHMGTDIAYEGDGRPSQNIIRNNEMIGYKSPLIRMKESTANTFDNNQFTLISDSTPLDLFDFSPGYGNIVKTQQFSADSSSIGTYMRTAIRTDTASLTEAWSVLQDIAVGETINVVLHSAGETRTVLEDSRNLVFMAGEKQVATQVAPTGSVMEIAFETVGGKEPITLLDLAIMPDSGSLSVTPKLWDASADEYEWVEASEDGTASSAHTLGSLAADGCYEIEKNGNLFLAQVADADGVLKFVFEDGYSKSQRWRVARADATVCAPDDEAAALAAVAVEDGNGGGGGDSAETIASTSSIDEAETESSSDAEVASQATASDFGVGSVERPAAANIILLAALAIISLFGMTALGALFLLRAKVR